MFTKYIGIPFKHKGETIEGCDCWGFCRLVYKETLNKDLPNLLDLYNETMNYKECSHVYPIASDYFRRIPNDEAKKFDIVLLRIASVPVHVGIYLDDTKFIHCHEGTGSIISRFDDLNYKNKIDSIWRLNESPS